jgi:hypothetical protein
VRVEFETTIGAITYRVESLELKDGLRATVSAFNAKGEPVAVDRLTLDRAKDRERFAEAAGLDLKDLVTVRETAMDQLAGVPADDNVTDAILTPEALEAGQCLLDTPDLLAQAWKTAQGLGYTGPEEAERLFKLVYLAMTSRVLSRPINLVVVGPSAAGKSFLVMTTARLFPSAATYVLSGMSERLLAYTDADLRHCVLIIGEVTALHREGIGASLLRSIAWEGHLVYETVEKTNDGLKPRRIEKPGPTGFITTTGQLEAELSTRVLEVSVPDTPEVTRVIVKSTAERANGKAPDDPDLAPWIAAQHRLATEGVHEVTIPYAEQLAERVPHDQVRMRRDFTQLLTLIQAHAVLYQRQRKLADDGRIIATIDDYAAVYELVAPIFQAIAAGGVTKQVRETVQAVQDLTPEPGDTATVLQVAQHIGIDKSAASRRNKRAIKAGFVVNLEDKQGRPLKLRLGDPLPKERPALPAPDALSNSENVLHSPAHNRATVQPQRESPRTDAEYYGSTPVQPSCNRDATAVQPEPAQLQPRKPVQPRLASTDADNRDPVARLRGCTEGSDTQFSPASTVCRVCREHMPWPESQRLGICLRCRGRGSA